MYDYDRLDRVFAENWLETVGGNSIHTVGYQYDKLGRVKLQVDLDPAASSFRYQTFDYDDLDRVTAERNYYPALLSLTPGPKVEQVYEYDILGANDWQQFVQTRYTQRSTTNGTDFTNIGETVTFTDKHGRTARIEDTPDGQATKKVEFTYDDADRLIDVARIAGSFFFDTTYDYDDAGRVSLINHYRDGQPEPFVGYGYEYDLANRIRYQGTTRDMTIPAFPVNAGGAIRTFYYDASGQLTETLAPFYGDDESFTYDDNGNRTTSTANGTTDIGDYNRLEEDADYTYLYDKEGNRTRRTANVGGAYTVYSWDHRNRLTKVEDYNSTNVLQQSVTYAYDAGDRPVSRTDAVDTHHYVNDGSQRVLEFRGSGARDHRYTWGPGADQLLADDLYSASDQYYDALWAATDHLGSVNDLLDSTEEIIEHREYNSFGEFDAVYDILGNTKPVADLLTDVGHAGSLWDEGAEFYRKGNRPYDPYTSQFLTTDFGGFIDGPNLYWYAKNNPIIYFDPSGFSALGNPLNNLYSATRDYNPLPSFFGPINSGSTRSSSSSRSTSISTASLINSFSGPTRVPVAKDFNTYGLLQVPASRPYVDVNTEYLKRVGNNLSFQRQVDDEYALGRLEGAARNGSWAAESMLFFDRKYNSVASGVIGALAEPTFVAAFSDPTRENIRAFVDNASERALKRVAIGRKNWLFAGHDQAAENHARLWSLIASAERHGLDPQRYLTSVLAKIGQTPADDLDQFLPDVWKAEDAAELVPAAE